MSLPHPKLDALRIDRAPAKGAPLRKRWLILIPVFGGVVGAIVWWFALPAPLPVRTAVARQAAEVGADRTVLNASGYVTARREATVSSKITGKVNELLIEEGQRVKAGELLARLDDSNVQANLRLARAQHDAAKAVLEETQVRLLDAEREWRRQRALLQTRVAAQADNDRAEAAALALRARLGQQQRDVVVAERTVAVWEQQVDDTLIRAPFDGVVTSKNAQPGEMISPMSAGGFTRTGICTLVDMGSLEIEIDVNESYINRVEPGQSVNAVLDAHAGWTIPCKVIAIIPTADRQKSTVRVRVGFDRLDARILPEMSVKVAFRETGAAPAARRFIKVPKSAIVRQDDREVVFLLQNGRAERRAVSTAGTEGTDVQVSAGISAGEHVILEPPPVLRDGVRVRQKSP